MSHARLVSYPLLRLEVIKAFLEQYKSQRAKKDSGFLTKALNFNDITSEVEKTCKDLLKRVEAAQLMMDKKASSAEIVNKWIEIIQFISEKAKERQNRPLDNAKGLFASVIPTFVTKSAGMSHTDSVFAQTLHAIRTMLISCLSIHPEYKGAFNQKISSLVEEAQCLTTEIKTDQMKSLDVQHKQTELQKMLLTASSLGHLSSIIDANNLSFFPQYCMPEDEYISKLPQDVSNTLNFNRHVPICFQQEWFKIFYETVVREETKQQFNDFIKSALKQKSTVNNIPNNQLESSPLTEIVLDSSEDEDDLDMEMLRGSPSENKALMIAAAKASSSAPNFLSVNEASSSAPNPSSVSEVSLFKSQEQPLETTAQTAFSKKQQKKQAKAAAAAQGLAPSPSN